MSGHSKWATTKHKKAVIDAKRGKLFAKLIKNIEVAARTGGGDPDGNPTLYDAIQKARKTSVPLDNIERAVKRGSGAEAGGADWQTIMYEGYGPSGVAVLIECLTDNRNRAAMEVRTAMTRNGGSMADPGSVSYLFNRKGVVIVPEDEPRPRTTCWPRCSTPAPRRSTTSASRSRSSARPPTWSPVRTALQEAGIDYDSADMSFLPSVQVPLDEDGARKVFRLIDALEDLDDVQNVYANFDVSDEVLEARRRRRRARVMRRRQSGFLVPEPEELRSRARRGSAAADQVVEPQHDGWKNAVLSGRICRQDDHAEHAPGLDLLRRARRLGAQVRLDDRPSRPARDRQQVQHRRADLQEAEERTARPRTGRARRPTTAVLRDLASDAAGRSANTTLVARPGRRGHALRCARLRNVCRCR